MNSNLHEMTRFKFFVSYKIKYYFPEIGVPVYDYNINDSVLNFNIVLKIKRL